jgi:putative FmdB family regulatory protein
MPIFEYECSSCAQQFEELVSSSASDEEVVCPNCGSKKTRRVLSAFAVSNSGKGSGSSSAHASSKGSNCGPGGFS